jgi:alkanesulfonate monooxygenase SsuD/methylene tetrahydromethanopterin reductase-like flavin-dependent oxidoreductase (luciferase family)
MTSRKTTFGLLSLGDHLSPPGPERRLTQAERYELIVKSGVWAEQAGFSHLGIGEHHFSDYIVPSPNLLLASIAARTKSIRLGTSVTLLASRDPVRVAEDLATLDVLSQGRAGMTFARGVLQSNLTAFGVTDPDDLRPRFEENLRLVIRLLTEERVTWSGHYRCPLHDVRIEPRPLQQPHPAIFIGGGLSQESCDLAAELGLPLALPSLFRHPEDYLPIVARYKERMTANGFAQRISLSLPSFVHVAPTSQEARARWRPYLESYVGFAQHHRGGFGRPLDYENLLRGPAICGSPAEVVDRLGAVNETLGLSLHYLMADGGGLPAPLLQEVIETLGQHVLPRLGAKGVVTNESARNGA